MSTQQEFMMIFRFASDLSYQPTEQEQAEMQQQWGSFIGNLAIAEKLVSTHRLGFEGTQIQPNQSIENGISISEGETMSGYLVAKASSLEEATELAKACPILQANGTVEVRSTIAM